MVYTTATLTNMAVVFSYCCVCDGGQAEHFTCEQVEARPTEVSAPLSCHVYQYEYARAHQANRVPR